MIKDLGQKTKIHTYYKSQYHMVSVKNIKSHSFLCSLNILNIYFSIYTIFIVLLEGFYPYDFFLPVCILSFTLHGFTILYCPSTTFEITAGSSEKHSDKGRLNCDFRRTVSYKNKEVKKLILFQIRVCVLSSLENC